MYSQLLTLHFVEDCITLVSLVYYVHILHLYHASCVYTLIG